LHIQEKRKTFKNLYIMAKKQKRFVPSGIAVISSTLNNTIVSVSDMLGNTLCWASSGTSGFKGSRKKTAFAAQLASQNVSEKAKEMGVQNLEIIVRGRGKGRESAIRALKAAGFTILALEDQTPLPHNGCRPPKRRRL